MLEVEFVCLAKSREGGGFCVAGKRLDNGQWIRPCNPGVEIKESCVRREQIEESAGVGDILVARLTCDDPAPGCQHQVENRILKEGNVLEKTEGQFPFKKLFNMVDDLSPLQGKIWKNGQNTQVGLNNVVPQKHINHKHGSLLFLHTKEASVFFNHDDYKNRPYADFFLGGTQYKFRCTAEGEKDKIYRDCFLCISLTRMFPQDSYNAYKLAAAVIAEENYGR